MNEDALSGQLRAVDESFGWCELEQLAVFRVVGDSARDTLQRVLSQDVARLGDGQTTLALMLTATGQCRALMTVLAVDGGFLLAAPPGRGGALRGTLERFLLLSRCRLDQEPLHAVAAAGPAWSEAVAAIGLDAQVVTGGGVACAASGGGTALAFPAAMLGLDGAVVAVGDETLQDLRARLAAVDGPRVTREALELARVRRGAAAWGEEVSEEYLPHEIGLVDAAVSTRKGCYVGQETMARLETYGHPNRCLVGVRQLDGPSTSPDLPIDLTPEGEEKPRGALTSWVRHPELGGLGLAVVRRKHAGPGNVVAAADRRFRIAPFPLW